ncbi:MAG TPA: hypothetical protein VG942_14080 [Hyphomonadaceae bacterium]|nr:hypothetical protein [Hyphomonadaceae bacterium]
MKRLIPVLALLVSPAAFADTLPQQVGAEAKRLLAQVDGLKTTADARPALKPAPLSDALVADLQRFGLSASRLSIEIDQRGGPTDLRCIFRGMAEETDNQLKAASASATNADQSKALGRLSHMLKDAVDIAPAVGDATPAASPANAKSLSGSCPVARKY